jgi:hypothetical protein
LETHVKVLAVLYIVFGVMGTPAGFGIMALLGAIGLAGVAHRHHCALGSQSHESS